LVLEFPGPCEAFGFNHTLLEAGGARVVTRGAAGFCAAVGLDSGSLLRPLVDICAFFPSLTTLVSSVRRA